MFIIYVLPAAAFALKWQCGVAATEILHLTKPKIFIICPFTKKPCQTLFIFSKKRDLPLGLNPLKHSLPLPLPYRHKIGKH